MIFQICCILVFVNTIMVQCSSLNGFQSPKYAKFSFYSTTKFIPTVNGPSSISLNNNLALPVVLKQKHETLLKALKTRHSSNPKLRSLEDFSSSLYEDEPQFFCGETLSNAVEYYCVNIKGTSVYGPGNDDDDNFVIRKLKSKREYNTDEYQDSFQGNLNNRTYQNIHFIHYFS
jgi:hypothetical protein